ncbi:MULTISPECIES: 2-aminoethylphosphonate ABC transporter substrate-binding protein [Rhodococcus]|uniref:2-aminoethylphosphonate ABC transporter substrate-binding protein n=1 Tax=Rhodococcus TaxID=1827 RepID=UPI0006BA6DE7|nr:MULTISPECIES: 2-aminoethylphosphonate ABC transporter substrate-binding protein [Rhodococcus]KPH18588.1 phosphonate ABC transporter substrate-binding protein [Rhodococcus sp. ADH]MBS3690193.1 2-aminoethylphosphonate ABC transporter substrate-binding protein [Rhodococcus qingshengii]MBX9148074.1 2-aminoethylphosphonate ABC transporter substrate-binding protein [Rhodococcus qingshengii]MCQ4151632.1 2-aminoethylphosphonate ABC transporter substrate-binding protein [Rhodococcus qingshengii]
MRLRPSIAAAALAVSVLSFTTACGGTGTAAGSDTETVTVYSADGLSGWYKGRFDAFTAQTGIAVNLVEAGSGEVVSRVEKEQSNPQADVIITLPPFIQKADAQGLLEPSGIDTSAVPTDEKDDAGKYVPVVENYLSFIANPTASPAPQSWDDLLTDQFKGKLQYSTPGQAGDGTAVLLLLQHLMGKEGALDYLGKLQANNVGPSSSTGKLQPKVSNGELLVANGDVQMNLASIADDGSKFDIFFPAGADGTRTTIALPYVMGLAKSAPSSEQAKKLMEFLLSEESQKTVATDALGVSVREDVRSAAGESTDKNTPSGVLQGVNVWTPNWNDVLSSLDADIAAYQKATGS